MRYWIGLLGLLAGPVCAQLVVTDGMGQSVTLAAPARRIVVLVPHAVETLYAIGAGRQLVAAVDYSDYPPQAKQLPRVGGYSGISVEAILRQRPDLVVAWRDGGNVRELARLRELGVPIYMSAPVQLGDIPREMRALGVLSGQRAGAEREAKRFEQTLAAVTQRYASRAPLRVFVQVSETPIFTVSNRSFLGSLLTLCGARNVFAEVPVPAPQVSVEAVVAARPQVMLAFEATAHQRWRGWPQIPAVRDGLQLTIPQDSVSRPGPRLAAGAGQLCAVLDTARTKAGLTPP